MSNMRECHNISFFKKGDIITRGQRVEPKDGLYPDYSYMGKPVEYMGIENNQIYIRPINRSVAPVPFDRWQNGWLKFIVPEGVFPEEIV